MPKKLRLGILGGGGDSLIGVLHRVASHINDNYQITGAVFNPDFKANKAFAREIDVPLNRIYTDFDTFIKEEMKLPENERIQVCAVLTPNFLHFPMAKKLLDNGFHVICEKPMTTTLKEAKILQKAHKKSGAVGWINTIIHSKKKRASVWRLDPKKAGISSCMGDIGVHAFNLVEYTTGLKVKSLLCDFNYLYRDNKMDVDGTVLIRMDDHIKGVIRSSQVATGEENGLAISIYGAKASFHWEQENPNFLYMKSDTQPTQVYKPGHAYNSKLSLDGTKLPAGHPEGIFDSMANIYLGVARAVRGKRYNDGEFPTMEDGVRGMNFIEATVESNKKKNSWVKLMK